MLDWIDFYRDGGSTMHAILAVAVVGFAVVLERFWRLWAGQRVDMRRLMALVQGRILAGDTKAALRLVPESRSYIRRVVRAGLMAGVASHRAEAAVHEERLLVEPQLTRWLPTLSSLANLAMFIGLLGTIFGMIGGFHCGGTMTTAAQRSAALSKQIAIAIHTTGFGILVGVGLLSARLFLQLRADSLARDVALCGARVVNLVRVAVEPVPLSDSPYR